MKKTFLMIVAMAAVVFGAFSCSKPYDDSELRDKISGLETRISKLESLQSQIDNLKTTIEKLQGGIKVTEVSKDGEVVTIKFSDGTSVSVSKTIISVTEVNGVYCWAVNGEVIKDPAGNVIPVGTQAPKLRAAADGTLEYSIDGGKTWAPLAGKTEAPTVEETDEAYIIHFGESSFTLPKDQPFYIRFAVASNFSIAYGETAEVKYEVIGGDSDSEVGILAVSEAIEAEVASGAIKVTNNNKTAESGRIIVYAANHKGKSDIKTFVFKTEPSDEPAEFTAVLDGGVEEIVADGGTFYLNVKADEDYTVKADVDWITVTPPTRALYEDKLAVKVEKNPTTEPRTGNITLTSKESDLAFSVAVKQAAGEPEPQNNYMDATGYYTIEATGKYNYYDEKSKKWTVKTGTVTYDGFILPADDDSEDYYKAGILEEYEGEYYVSSYIIMRRNAETGILGFICEQTDEWESDNYGTIYDWQYAYIEYDKDLYYVTGDYVIAISEDGYQDGVIEFPAGESLPIDGFDDPFDIVGLELMGMKDGDDGKLQGVYLYGDIPFPATFTKTAELPEAEAASIRSKLPKKNVSLRAHSFAPAELQRFTVK